MYPSSHVLIVVSALLLFVQLGLYILRGLLQVQALDLYRLLRRILRHLLVCVCVCVCVAGWVGGLVGGCERVYTCSCAYTYTHTYTWT